MLNANRFHYIATSPREGCGTWSPGWIFRRVGCYGDGRCAEGTRKSGVAAKTAAHAGFFLNYPILGIGLNGDHCLCFNCAELPRSKRILKPPDTAIRWFFLLGACRVRCSAPEGADTVTVRQSPRRLVQQQQNACTTTHTLLATLSCRLPRGFAADSSIGYPQVACDRNCKQNDCALRQPSSGTMPQLHRAPRGGTLSRASCKRRVHPLSI